MANIFLDYGHGGSDPGAIGGNYVEKVYTLKIGLKVAEKLRKLGHTVKESRTDDVYLSLRQRTNIENNWDADLSVSLHINAFNGVATGVEVLYYFKSIKGEKLAKALYDALVESGIYESLKVNGKNPYRGIKTKNLALTRDTRSPAALIEYVFIDNPQDQKLLDNNINEMVDATIEGIQNYLGVSYTPSTPETPITDKGQAFINEINGYIQNTDKRILPSVSIAQAILESDWGKSELAVNAKNLFGIKASSDWKGTKYSKLTKEEVNGKLVTVTAEFRKYNSWQDSVKDHDTFFESTEWRKNNYKKVLEAKDYLTQCNALTGTYATDSQYSKKLISLIEKYKLMDFDKEEEKPTYRKLTFNGIEMPSPAVKNGRAYYWLEESKVSVPVREYFENLGCKVEEVEEDGKKVIKVTK